MTATLTWIDHDPAARDRALRILSLIQEKENRDGLGFVVITTCLELLGCLERGMRT